MKLVLKNPANLLIMPIMVLAMAFTFSCSSDDPEGDGNSGGGKGNNIANYKTVKIGTQTWMAENLDNRVAGSKCYNNDPANCDTRGSLYDWETAKTVCPSGWHVPSRAEWDALKSFIESDKTCTSCDAKHLKATSGWREGGNGEDTYGFAALPGGYGRSNGTFANAGTLGYWWMGDGYHRHMYYAINNTEMRCDDGDHCNLLSVRCLQDVRQ